MRLSQSQNVDANEVTQVLLQYKFVFELIKIFLLCQCPFEDSFPISFRQPIQSPCYLTKAKYESSIEILQTKKTS